MKKRWYFILLVNLLPLLMYGQDNFYTIDSMTYVGFKLVDGGDIGNSRFCQVKVKEKVIKYTPYEVKEYGFKDGRTYKSLPVKINDTVSRYFLERLAEGKVTLYQLKTGNRIRKYYWMENGSDQLIELPSQKTEYRMLFDSLTTDCSDVSRIIPHLRLNKYSLTRFGKFYNDCGLRPFPTIQVGFTVGLNASLLSAFDQNSIYSALSNNDLNFSMGVFADIPIRFSNFSFHPEAHFKQMGMTQAFDNQGTNYDLVINYSSLCFPLLFRYTLLSNNISPYFQAGPVYTRVLENAGSLYEYQKVNNDVFIKITDSPVLQNDLGGFSVGSGIISKYGSKYSWFGEIRYSKYNNLLKESKTINLSEISLATGFIF